MSGSPHILTTIQSVHFYRTRPGLSWATQLHGQNELSGQLSDRHAFNMTRGPSMFWSLIDTDRITISHHTTNIQDSTRSLFIQHHMLFSTIANIANRASVSTYISQVTGNHPTSIGLSMAKHIFDPGPTQGLRYMFGQGNYMHQEFPINSHT